jgi:hypothetical protein
MRRFREETGQTLVLLAGACVVLLLFVGVLAALGQALLGRGRLQRAADLAAISAARATRDDFPRLFDRSPNRGSPRRRIWSGRAPQRSRRRVQTARCCARAM